jgi:short-subunit dehydrogenase
MHQARGEETVDMIQSPMSGSAFYHYCDVTKLEDLEKVAQTMDERFGGTDIIVNNAGIAAGGAFENETLAGWERMLSINLMGVVKGCKVFVPRFKRQGHGHIVNIASMAGLLSMPFMSSYNVAKAGVVALSETLYGELTPYNIHTTCICPSFFKTNLTESVGDSDKQLVENIQRYMEKSAISAEEIADMIYAAVENKQLFLLPHEKAREAWQLKQTAPDIFFAESVKYGQKLKDNAEQVEA